jgi:hypothetical protein
MKDKIVDQVLIKYEQRSNVGINKYKTTLENNNKDNYLKHLQEELMDATLYIEKLISMEQEITTLVKLYLDDKELGKKIRNLII